MILRNSIIEGMKDPDLDQKQRVLEMLQVSIEVKEKIATVECVIPTKTVSARLVSSSLNVTAPTIS